MNNKPFTVAVTGGRDYDNSFQLCTVLATIEPQILVLGCCPTGADKIALDWAIDNGVFFIVFNADWERFGSMAGPRRNADMIYIGQPDVLVEFPGGKGTKSCVSIAKKAGITIREVGKK